VVTASSCLWTMANDFPLLIKIINRKPSISVKQIVLGVQALLTEPNIDDPAQKSAFLDYRDNRTEYIRKVKAQAAKMRPLDDL
jgi:ubiquitin-protein ligase